MPGSSEVVVRDPMFHSYRMPQSRVANNPAVQNIRQNGAQTFGVSAPNNLTINDVQRANTLAQQSADQLSALKRYAKSARQIIKNVADAETMRGELVQEVQSGLRTVNSVVAKTTITGAQFDADQKLLMQTTGHGVGEIAAKAGATSQVNELSFQDRLRLIAHKSQIDVTNLGRQTHETMQNMSTDNQNYIQEQSARTAQYRQQTIARKQRSNFLFNALNGFA